jgi:hypothetical protein
MSVWLLLQLQSHQSKETGGPKTPVDQPRRKSQRLNGSVVPEGMEAPLENIPAFLPHITHNLRQANQLPGRKRRELCSNEGDEGFKGHDGLLRALSTDEYQEQRVKKGNRAEERKAIRKRFGHIQNVHPGQVFERKLELYNAFVHLNHGGGISGEGGVGAYSICDSIAFEDKNWFKEGGCNALWFTGEGGNRDKSKRESKGGEPKKGI